MTRRVAVVLVAFLADCATSGTTVAREPPAPIGGYFDYTAALPGQHVQGKLRVLGDTIIVVPNNDYCQPVKGSPNPLTISYTCNGPGRFESLSLTLDRRNPVQFSKWAASYRVRKQRQICVRSTIRDGREVCLERGVETYEDTESKSGTLLVRRVP